MHEFAQLQALADAGPVETGRDSIQVTAAGCCVMRAVAMVFDRYLQQDKLRDRFARII